jgi:N-acetylmuramoyl-L-alanine amidase
MMNGPLQRRLWRVQAAFCKMVGMHSAMPCVGLVVLAGCLSFVIAPDEEPSLESKITSAVIPSLLTVVIDPGHGGFDDGARANGLTEQDLTLDVGLRVEKLLQTFGFPTVLTRRGNQHVSLEERAAIANRVEHSIFVSIHFNQGHTSASGVETFYASEKLTPESAWNWIGFFHKPEREDADNGEALAGYIQTALVTRMESANRGIKARELYVVRHVRAPAVLIEGGFLSNPFDARLLGNPEYRDRLAAAVVEGVISFQKVQPRPQPQFPRLAQAGG